MSLLAPRRARGRAPDATTRWSRTASCSSSPGTRRRRTSSATASSTCSGIPSRRRSLRDDPVAPARRRRGAAPLRRPRARDASRSPPRTSPGTGRRSAAATWSCPFLASANRDPRQFPASGHARRPPADRAPRRLRLGHPLLPRRLAGAPRGPRRPDDGPRAACRISRSAPRRRAGSR